MRVRPIIIVVTVLLLAVLNLTLFTLSGVIVATLLGITALMLLWRKLSSENAIFIFLIAELSPIGVRPELALALLYQAISLTLLSAVLSSFESIRPLAEYRSPTLRVAIAVSAFLVLSYVVLYVKPLYASDLRLFGLLIGSALVVLVGLLLIDQHNVHIRRLNRHGASYESGERGRTTR